MLFIEGPESARLSSQSIRSVASGSMGLKLADPLLRQNEEVLQVDTQRLCLLASCL